MVAFDPPDCGKGAGVGLFGMRMRICFLPLLDAQTPPTDCLKGCINKGKMMGLSELMEEHQEMRLCQQRGRVKGFLLSTRGLTTH